MALKRLTLFTVGLGEVWEVLTLGYSLRNLSLFWFREQATFR